MSKFSRTTVRCQDMASPRSGGYWPDGRGEGSATQPNSRYPTSWPTRARGGAPPTRPFPPQQPGRHGNRPIAKSAALGARSSSLSIDSRARGAPTQRLTRAGRADPATLVSRATRNQTDPLAPPAGHRRRFLVFGLGANAGARAIAARECVHGADTVAVGEEGEGTVWPWARSPCRPSCESMFQILALAEATPVPWSPTMMQLAARRHNYGCDLCEVMYEILDRHRVHRAALHHRFD
jgi:hypothetical protein